MSSVALPAYEAGGRIVVRRGTLDDVDAIGALHARSRWIAYRGIIPADRLDRIRAEDLADEWRTTYVADGDRRRLLVADVGESMVGFASVGHGWLHAIHVEEGWKGIGVGGALMAAALRELRELGFDEAHLWVVAQNDRARRFYVREGWRLSGREVDDEIGGAPTHSVEYLRSTRHPERAES